MKRLIYTKAAQKSLSRIPVNIAHQIVAKIQQYARDPQSLERNVTKLQGREGYRLRVGRWRVIFDEAGNVFEILEIGPRGGIYG
jgi:mRNA interferase RelE/StbE